jgi:hypothetical protein
MHRPGLRLRQGSGIRQRGFGAHAPRLAPFALGVEPGLRAWSERHEGLLFLKKKKQKDFIHLHGCCPGSMDATEKSFFASFCSQKEDS